MDDSAEDHIGAITARVERRMAARMADFVAKGGTPASREGLLVVGMPDFSFSCRVSGAMETEIGLRFVPDGGGDAVAVVGSPWPGGGCRMDPSEFLRWLSASWGVLAGVYLPYGRALDGVAVQCTLAGSRFSFEVGEKNALSIVDEGRRTYGRRSFGADSVVVVEILRSSGDILSRHCREMGIGGVSDVWDRLSLETDLPPFPPDCMAGGMSDEETSWYAGKLGQRMKDYVRSAQDLRNRQIAFAVGETVQEPEREEWDVRLVTTRSADEVEGETARLAGKLGQTVDDYVADAIATRNDDARRLLVFGREEAVDAPEDPTPGP